MESGAKDDEQSSLAVFGRDLWCFLSFLSLLCVGRINDTTVSLGRIISHMIYRNYWLNVCDLNCNNFISSPLLLCITANFSSAGSHCAVIVRAIVFSLYLPLKYNANYSTTIFHVRSAKALYAFSVFFPVSPEKGITSPYKPCKGDILSFIRRKRSFPSTGWNSSSSHLTIISVLNIYIYIKLASIQWQ